MCCSTEVKETPYSSLLMTEQAQISTILSGIHAYYEPEELVGKDTDRYHKSSTESDDGN